MTVVKTRSGTVLTVTSRSRRATIMMMSGKLCLFRTMMGIFLLPFTLGPKFATKHKAERAAKSEIVISEHPADMKTP